MYNFNKEFAWRIELLRKRLMDKGFEVSIQEMPHSQPMFQQAMVTLSKDNTDEEFGIIFNTLNNVAHWEFHKRWG